MAPPSLMLHPPMVLPQPMARQPTPPLHMVFPTLHHMFLNTLPQWLLPSPTAWPGLLQCSLSSRVSLPLWLSRLSHNLSSPNR